MAWITVQYQLKSSAPLLMHNGQTADPLNKFTKALKQITNKRNKTDADHEEVARLEFMASLYMDKSGPVIPAFVVDSLVINAAKKSRDGQKAKSGCYCPEPAALKYKGPREADKLWADETFRFRTGVRVEMKRVQRTRPIFNDWSAVVTLSIEDTIVNITTVDDWMHVAGTQIGVGDWRPQYGRFTAERLNGK